MKSKQNRTSYFREVKMVDQTTLKYKSRYFEKILPGRQLSEDQFVVQRNVVITKCAGIFCVTGRILYAIGVLSAIYFLLLAGVYVVRATAADMEFGMSLVILPIFAAAFYLLGELFRHGFRAAALKLDRGVGAKANFEA